MYKFADWFIEYMAHIEKFCNIDDVKNAICTEDVLKGNYEVFEKYPNYIACCLSLHLDKGAIKLLEKYPHKICWSNISSNPNADTILEKYQDKINWHWISINTSKVAVKLISENMNKIMLSPVVLELDEYKNHISWKLLHYNYEAIHLLDLYKENINWKVLSYINHENVIEYLSKNVEHIHWLMLSFNSCAHSIFIKYPEYVNWKYLSLQPFAINILTDNQEYIDWDYLSFNENAIPLLMQNYDKINWSAIKFNKNGYKIMENNLDRITWTEWKIFTKLIKKLDKLDKLVYISGPDYINIITDISYELKQNYKNNLDHFGKCFVYESLLNYDDKEIINTGCVNFYICGYNYSLLLRDKTDCVYPTIQTYKHNFIQHVKQCDKSFAALIKEASTYVGPQQYNPINGICNNIEFQYIVQTNPDKILWVLKLLDSFGCDESIFLNVISHMDIITLDYQKLAIERTNILREELMMKVWHPSNIEKLLNSVFTNDDL
jgi:hypothetical protein